MSSECHLMEIFHIIFLILMDTLLLRRGSDLINFLLNYLWWHLLHIIEVCVRTDVLIIHLSLILIFEWVFTTFFIALIIFDFNLFCLSIYVRFVSSMDLILIVLFMSVLVKTVFSEIFFIFVADPQIESVVRLHILFVLLIKTFEFLILEKFSCVFIHLSIFIRTFNFRWLKMPKLKNVLFIGIHLILSEELQKTRLFHSWRWFCGLMIIF